MTASEFAALHNMGWPKGVSMDWEAIIWSGSALKTPATSMVRDVAIEG